MNFRTTLQRISFALLIAAASTSALAKKEEIQASSTTNPAPTEAFAAFDRIEVSPIAMGAPYAGQKANDAALKNLQAALDERLAAWLADINAKPASAEPPRVLRVEPRIDKIRFIGGGARVFAGAFAGKSRVLVKLRITDAATGAVIAEPEFYQHASGMAGAYSFGGADKAMLERAATLVTEFLKTNHAAPAETATGWE